MWIRSQNKQELVCAEAVVINMCFADGSLTDRQVDAYVGDDVITMGTYSSLENAIRAVDRLEDAITQAYLNGMHAQYNAFVNRNDVIFYMPSDQEVGDNA